ncbi:hypothetical protein ACJX4N_002505 [Enterococcus faecalis]|uniref:hypothetical protein n=1 Tax=Enterococcus faecalis TaxID=1351 RepID=UPI0012E0DE16|nr:hypothetical protein [Enterococcus faecalis]EGO5016465.1 hypothetical protein [Enterococcus faecalis]EGO6561336.1 hypothetical protein [Enterococcus faecalis]EGO7561162.1 hypothetical protein [Enterococcus faecalis]EGO7742851.1 hypothetical protein [Enterococcus faecalis]EGO8387394.1 hypothetical protein [Enterococcus faecalis]
MFKNSIMYFSDKKEVEEVRNLLKEYNQAVKNEDKNNAYGLEGKIITSMKERIQSRYLMVVKKCLEMRDDNWGFTIMSINCILIELYYQLDNGVDDSRDFNEGNVEDAFRQTIPRLAEEFNQETGSQFYKDIRCKLIHQAQTNTNVAISLETPEMIYPYEPEYTIYNPQRFFEEITKLYDELFDKALIENNEMIKRNIINKVRCIAYKK